MSSKDSKLFDVSKVYSSIPTSFNAWKVPSLSETLMVNSFPLWFSAPSTVYSAAMEDSCTSGANAAVIAAYWEAWSNVAFFNLTTLLISLIFVPASFT